MTNEERIKKIIARTTFVSNGRVTNDQYDLKFLEAYMCCVALAVDDKGLLLAIPNDISLASVISRSLLKNLERYGYKIVPI